MYGLCGLVQTALSSAGTRAVYYSTILSCVLRGICADRNPVHFFCWCLGSVLVSVVLQGFFERPHSAAGCPVWWAVMCGAALCVLAWCSFCLAVQRSGLCDSLLHAVSPNEPLGYAYTY
jgi:hypothetical protein